MVGAEDVAEQLADDAAPALAGIARQTGATAERLHLRIEQEDDIGADVCDLGYVQGVLLNWIHGSGAAA